MLRAENHVFDFDFIFCFFTELFFSDFASILIIQKSTFDLKLKDEVGIIYWINEKVNNFQNNCEQASPYRTNFSLNFLPLHLICWYHQINARTDRSRKLMTLFIIFNCRKISWSKFVKIWWNWIAPFVLSIQKEIFLGSMKNIAKN